MSDADAPYATPALLPYIAHLLHSYHHWTGRTLADSPEALYDAPFVVVSHGMQPDPVFCYANLAAQRLWDMGWERFTSLPSRLSAQPDARDQRERLLKLAEQQGYVGDYSGIRVTSGGKRFMIRDCVLWNVTDEAGSRIGQAATFDQWEWL